MIRQLLSLCLVTALLASQAVVCCGHSHEETNSQASRAHIHLGGHSHCHGAGHHHHHGDSHHGSNHPENSDRDDSPILGSECCCDHDSDAVYFGEQDPILLDSSQLAVKKSPCSVTVPPSRNYGYPLSEDYRSELLGPMLAHPRARYLQTIRLLL